MAGSGPRTWEVCKENRYSQASALRERFVSLGYSAQPKPSCRQAEALRRRRGLVPPPPKEKRTLYLHLTLLSVGTSPMTRHNRTHAFREVQGPGASLHVFTVSRSETSPPKPLIVRANSTTSTAKAKDGRVVRASRAVAGRRASQQIARARRACPTAGMPEFAPARDRRESQGEPGHSRDALNGISRRRTHAQGCAGREALHG